MKYNLLFFLLILLSKYSFSQILPAYHAVHHKPDNLILHLDASDPNSLDPNDLSVWNDLSSSNNDLSLVTGFTQKNYTLNSNPSFSSDNGGSIFFKNDAYSKSTFSSFSGNEFTFSIWIKTTQTNLGRLFSIARAPCCHKKQLIIWLTNSRLGVYRGSNSISTVNDGNWKFLTIVRNSSTYKYYINENLDKIRTGQDSKTFDDNNLVIGWDYRNNEPASDFVGNIGAIYFYNSALTADQVANNYNATKSRFEN